MPYVYILKSIKDGNLYIGSTINLRNRIKEHVKGYVKSTKNRRPLTIFGWRRFDDIKDTVTWEKKYKKSHGQLQRDVKNGKIVSYKI